MTASMPIAPKLESGTCIATAALIESAERVFLFHSNSPLHWIDLCTLIEAIILHDKIAFPVIHRQYATPLLQPLENAGLLDIWWPEAGLVTTLSSSKEDAWKPDKFGNISDRIAIMQGGWADEHFESLSETRKAAINRLALGVGCFALSKVEWDEGPILLWGAESRLTAADKIEEVAATLLQKGITKIQKMSPTERAAITTTIPSYNDYANCLRTLANDARAILIKSVIEEPYFDPVSVEGAARESLHAILKKEYEDKIISTINKFVKVVPASPFAGIALSRANSLDEIIQVAIKLRHSFRRSCFVSGVSKRSKRGVNFPDLCGGEAGRGHRKIF
jgi:hypothetical protein